MRLPVVGPSYQHSSIDVNYQRCLNLFFTPSGPDGKQPGALVPTAGLNELIDVGGTEIRCLGNVNGTVYVVSNANVYKLTINEATETATKTLLGSMDTSSGTVYMAANPTQVMWVDGSTKGYIYTTASGVFQEITASDSDFTGGGKVVFIDGYFVVNDPGTGQFYASAANNGLSWDPTDVATAESSTDNIISMAVSKGELWVIGENTTEIWYNAANVSGSPFSPRSGLQIQIGCGAADSVVELDDLIIWLDNRGFIVQSAVSPYIRSNNSGYDLQIISTEALTTEILSYFRRDDAIAMAYNDRGHLMYQISFPTAKKTWVFDYTTKVWHERSFYDTYADEHQHHLGQFYTQYRNLHIMGGIRSGILYLSKSTYYDDDGETIYRMRITPYIQEPEERKLMGIDRLELKLETGRAPATGEGDDPQITMRYSNNGGHSWSHHLNRSMGQMGEYAKRIIWNRLGVAPEWLFEFTIAEPVAFSIIDAYIKITEVED